MLSSPIFLYAKIVYVSMVGSDKEDGSDIRPVATFEYALELTRHSSDKHNEIIFRDGIYYLSHTIVLNQEDDGLSICAEHPGKAVISGGRLLLLKWRKDHGKVFSASVSGISSMDQLFVNGRRQRMARYPNVSVGNNNNIYDVWNLDNRKVDMNSFKEEDDALSPTRIIRWRAPTGGYVHAMHQYLWGDMHWLIKGKVGLDSLVCDGGWQNNRPASKHALYRMVENIEEELDAPGEWFYNKRKKRIDYIPEEGTDLGKAKIEVVCLKHLIEVRGSRDTSVRDITFRGLVFRHAARTFMENREPLLRSDWTIYRGGALVYHDAEDCKVTDCEFDQLGGNTIFVNGYNRRITISGCYIHDSGANGIAFVGEVSSVRNPRFTMSDLSLKDTIAGPCSDAYPSLCTVYDCLITRTGRDEKQTAPIQISMAYGIHVDHCSIYEVPRAGINISEGTFGGHLIENCDVFETVLETSDHGSFNSWGRDRYWVKDWRTTSLFLQQHPGAECWDMLGRNVIHHNRVRCDHGWDIDLDDGSSNYTITDNLLLHGGMKLREGKNRFVCNNIIVNNSLHPHVWYEKSGDVFTRNIVCGPYRPALMDSRLGENGKWGWQIDNNFFACSENAMLRYRKNGCDYNSLCGNPMFVCPERGNYQVGSASPTLLLGFHNFMMDDFGVISSRLKSIARTPQLPIYDDTINENDDQYNVYWWNSICMHRVTGESVSAYGMDLNVVGLSISALDEKGSFEKYGLMLGDLIIQVNGMTLNEHTDVDKLFSQQIKRLTLIRNQEMVEVDVRR